MYEDEYLHLKKVSYFYVELGSKIPNEKTVLIKKN